MSARILRPRREVCQLCDFMISRHSISRQTLRAQRLLSTTSPPPTKSARAQSKTFPASLNKKATKTRDSIKATPSTPQPVKDRPSAPSVTRGQLESSVQEAKAICSRLLSIEAPPSEVDTIHAFEQCAKAASLLLQDHTLPTTNTSSSDPASILLSIGESHKTTIQQHSSPVQTLIDELSHILRSIITDPKIFISPQILEKYVSLQSSLRKPSLLPEVFYLYANKPLPVEGSTPTQYTAQNPTKVANAVPATVADSALQAAIKAKQLIVAMDIVDLTYGTTAFRRAKFVRKGLLPVTGLAVAPLAAYAAASQLALLQDTMDTTLATNLAFAGILAYVGFTATIGVVVVTTANDQMDRVTWEQGMPLRERWIREEERAAVDRIAGGWGFKEAWRRGDEEGEEWEVLREWAGRKGMVVDAVELMEGME